MPNQMLFHLSVGVPIPHRMQERPEIPGLLTMRPLIPTNVYHHPPRGFSNSSGFSCSSSTSFLINLGCSITEVANVPQVIKYNAYVYLGHPCRINA
jgi:hypothetical protein